LGELIEENSEKSLIQRKKKKKKIGMDHEGMEVEDDFEDEIDSQHQGDS